MFLADQLKLDVEVVVHDQQMQKFFERVSSEMAAINSYTRGASGKLPADFRRWLVNQGYRIGSNPSSGRESITGASGFISNKDTEVLAEKYRQDRLRMVREAAAKRELSSEESKERKMSALTIRGGLGIMFFGMAIERMVGGLLKPAEDAVGIFDVLNAALIILFLPAMLDLLNYVFLPLLDAISSLPPGIREVIGGLAIALMALGSAAAFAGTMIMGIQGIGAALAVGAGVAGGLGLAAGGGALAGIPTVEFGAAAAGTGVAAGAAGGGILDTVGAFLGSAAAALSGYGATGLGLLGLTGLANGYSVPQLISPNSSSMSSSVSNVYNVTNNFNPSSAPNTHSGYAGATGVQVVGG